MNFGCVRLFVLFLPYLIVPAGEGTLVAHAYIKKSTYS